ncbi:hypothetical protein QYF36_013226 [Acer negundo]|nr:hypothetical protein QYF36_013226 [Acer negundo]
MLSTDRDRELMIPVTENLEIRASKPLSPTVSSTHRHSSGRVVRVDFLSVNGKPLSSSSCPCMLRFKSEPIRLLLTFLGASPLIAGYVSETQTVKVKIRDFMEGKNVPTSCLKVKIEQRAQFWLGNP